MTWLCHLQEVIAHLSALLASTTVCLLVRISRFRSFLADADLATCNLCNLCRKVAIRGRFASLGEQREKLMAVLEKQWVFKGGKTGVLSLRSHFLISDIMPKDRWIDR